MENQAICEVLQTLNEDALEDTLADVEEDDEELGECRETENDSDEAGEMYLSRGQVIPADLSYPQERLSRSNSIRSVSVAAVRTSSTPIARRKVSNISVENIQTTPAVSDCVSELMSTELVDYNQLNRVDAECLSIGSAHSLQIEEEEADEEVQQQQLPERQSPLHRLQRLGSVISQRFKRHDFQHSQSETRVPGGGFHHSPNRESVPLLNFRMRASATNETRADSGTDDRGINRVNMSRSPRSMNSALQSRPDSKTLSDHHSVISQSSARDVPGKDAHQSFGNVSSGGRCDSSDSSV